MSTFPLDTWLRLSVTVFHIPPREFWAMSVCDWLTLIAGEDPDISVADLRNLMTQFPDKESPDGQ